MIRADSKKIGNLRQMEQPGGPGQKKKKKKKKKLCCPAGGKGSYASSPPGTGTDFFVVFFGRPGGKNNFLASVARNTGLRGSAPIGLA